MNKLPTQLKALKGTLRPHRERGKHEAQPEPAIPSCPSHLDPEARKQWKRLTKELFPLGLLTEIDRTALALYCSAFSLWKKAEEHLQAEGVLVKTPNGFEAPNPWLSISRKSVEQLQKLGSEFGLSPLARSRVKAIPAKEPESKLAKFLRSASVTPIRSNDNESA